MPSGSVLLGHLSARLTVSKVRGFGVACRERQHLHLGAKRMKGRPGISLIIVIDEDGTVVGTGCARSRPPALRGEGNVIRRPSLVRQETVNQASGTSMQRCKLPLNTAKPAAFALLPCTAPCR